MHARTLLAAVFGAALLAGCAREASPPEPVRPVVLSKVAVGIPQDVAVFAGEVKPRHEADLAFRIAGKSVERKVDLGAFVRRGQPLARLDPADVALQAQAAGGSGRCRAHRGRVRACRVRALREPVPAEVRQRVRAGPEAQRDECRRRAPRAGTRQLAVMRNQAAYATLVAPADGVITAVSAEVGQVVAAGQGVMKLAETGEREIAIAVPEHRLHEIKAAQRLVVSLWAAPATRYPARVREIAPAVDPATRTFAVRVAVPNADATLGWGMTANVAVIGAGAPGQAIVPLASIYHRTDGTPAVWIYDLRPAR